MSSSQPQAMNRQAGFTLVELMVALALSLMLAVALLVMQTSLGKQTMRNSDVGVRDVQARAAMDLITKDLSGGGFMLGATYNVCNTLMTYNGTGVYIHHSVDAVAAANAAVMNFAAGLTLDYPPAASTVPSDVLVTTATTSGVPFSSAAYPLRPVTTGSTISPLGTSAVPLDVMTGIAATGDVGVVQVPVNGRLACLRAPVLSLLPAAIQSPANTFSSYAAQMTAAGYSQALTDAEFYANSFFYDFGPPASAGQSTVAYYVSNNNGSYPLLMRGEYNLMNDALISTQPVAAGVVSLQVRFGVDTATPPAGVVSAYETAAQVTTANQWDVVRSVRVAIVTRSLVDDSDPAYFWTPTAETPGTSAQTAAGSVVPGAPFATVPVPQGSKRHYLLQQTEIATRNLLW